MEELFSVLTQEEMAQITSTKGLRRAIDANEIKYITMARPIKGLGISRSLVADCRAGYMAFEELGRRLMLPTCDLCWNDKGISRKGVSQWDESIRHPRCDSCGIFFGGTHAGGKSPFSHSPWGICKGCSKGIVDTC